MNKNLYIIKENDSFGLYKNSFYFCTEKQIKKILFHKYITLKRQSCSPDKEYEYRAKKLYNKCKKRVRNKYKYFLDSKDQKKVEYKRHNLTYSVVTKRGFVFETELTYQKIDKRFTHYIEEFVYLEKKFIGFGNRQQIRKIWNTKLTELKKEICKTDINKITTMQSKLLYKLNYYARCSYEYDEYDEYLHVFRGKKISTQRRVR